MKRYGLLAAVLSAGLLAQTAVGGAQTISFADAITELAKACGSDIKKHCAGVNLGNNAIQQCLEKHQSSVSPTCTSTLATVTASIQQRLAAQASVMKVCEGSAREFCKGVQGEYHILQCLLKTKRVDSSKCNQAITDAGWR
jgi:hypothetical protein